MSDEEREDSFWDRISRINVIKCRQCGYSNPLGSRKCGECSSSLPLDEDDRSIEVVEGPAAQAQKADKVPLEDAKNLNALRKAKEGVLSGTMTKDEYRQIVSKVLYVSQTGVMVFETDLFKNKIAELPPEEADLARMQYQGFKKFDGAVTMMSRYPESGDVELVKKGYALAESAMIELDRIQDRQLDIVNRRKL